MVITKKDQKLILLIVSTIIVLWFIFLSVSSLFSKISSGNSNLNNLTDNKSEWLNSARQIEASDLKNRVILLDFWTYACVNCLHMIPEIKKLEEQFDNRLTVIGVHSGKFDNEKSVDSIRKAVLKYNIEHLVVNDADFKIWKSFEVKSWPTMILLDANGKVIKKYEGEISGKLIAQDVEKLVKKYNFQLNNKHLPIILEKNKTVDHFLKFPSGIEFMRNFSYKNVAKTNALSISNTGSNTILITSLNGDTLLEIGSGNSGSEDGDFADASFNSPRGLLFRDNILYVADTGNHLIRKIDFKTGKVKTIAGTENNGLAINADNKALETDLSSPWDLEFFPDKNHIIIANAGTHQLLKYNISNNIISPFAGSGNEDLLDGKFPDNALAQPNGLSAFGGNLYFVDSETSSLRVADKNGVVKTLIGSGLFDFGHKNGAAKEALMQHPVGLSADDTGVYIADTHNHIIRKFDLKNGTMSDYSGDIRGDGVGNKNSTSYNEPEAMVAVLDKFYIADTNNGRILELNRSSKNSKLLNILPPAQMPRDGLLEYLPNLEKIPSVSVKEKSEVSLSFEMKEGWKINDLAPSFFNLVEIKNDKEANLIASFDGEIIKSGAVKLPKLSKKYTYYLQGTVYYCEDKKDAICLVKSYEQKLLPKRSGNNQIKIEFIYK
jgi:thiol-disulfide isomerase/thioredoxin